MKRDLLFFGILSAFGYRFVSKFWWSPSISDCDTGLFTFLILQYSLFGGMMINFFCWWSGRTGGHALLLVFASIAIFEGLLNLAGIVIFFRADWSRALCLTNFERFVSIGVQFVTLGIVACIASYFLCKWYRPNLIQRRIRRRPVRTVAFQDELKALYVDYSRDSFSNFLSSHSNLKPYLDLPLITEEAKLLEAHFIVPGKIMSPEQRTAFDQNMNCSICLEDIGEKEDVFLMECRHYFHFHCVLAWLDKKMQCPLCKESLRMMLFNKIMAL